MAEYRHPLGSVGDLIVGHSALLFYNDEGATLFGTVSARGANALDAALHVLFYVGWITLAGLVLMPWVVETKGRALPE